MSEFMYLPFELVERKHWEAHEPQEKVELRTPVAYVLHSYTDSEPCFQKGQCIKRVQDIQARDLSEGLSDIKYNFLIGGDGCIYEGRGWNSIPDLHEDYPQLFERSIEIAHIGYEGEPTDVILHVLKLFVKYAIKKKYLKENYKYVKHFKEILKDEEHYMLDDEGKLELTCYKKAGEEVEKDESDDYKVLRDLSPGIPDYMAERDDADNGDDFPDLGGKSEEIEIENGVKVETSLLDPEYVEYLKRQTEKLDGKRKTYVYE